MTRLRRVTRQTFRSMQVRNFRLYFIGQIISASGSWMQSVAQMWLVLRLTNSGVALGATTALQFLPTLVGGAWGGVVADRVDKRRLLIATSAASGALALVLGAIVAAGVVQLWMVYVLALLLGCVTAIDNPARRAFVVEMVGHKHVANAVSLSSAVFTASRIIGPALAGLLIATTSIAWCFLLNGASFVAAIVALGMMHTYELHLTALVSRRKGQLREGLRYAWRNPDVRLPLLMTVFIGTLSFNFQVVLPLLARDTFGKGAGTFGALYAMMSLGSVTGALVVAHRSAVSRRMLVLSAFAFGGLLLVAAAAPTLGIEMLVLIPVGLAGMAFVAMANAALQTATDPQMRGRVMALFSVAFLGSTPIGAPIVGWVSQSLGPRAGLALGGIAALAAGLVALPSVRRPALVTQLDDLVAEAA